MYTNKRPTASSSSKAFNPSTTHPASIMSGSGGNTSQKREHVTQSGSGGGKREGTNPELGQSGGGGGGGTGAGSASGTGEGEKELDSLVVQKKSGRGNGKGIDSSKVHPGSIVSGDQGKGRDSKL